MVEQQYKPVLTQILALLDTACQGSLELLEQYSDGETAGAARLLNDLRAVVGAVGAAQEPLLPQLEHGYTSEMLENTEDTLNDIQRSIDAGDRERAAMKMEFQLFPFLRQLKESFYFWGSVYPDKGRMDRYYQEEFAEHYRNLYVDGRAAQYRLSIVVPAYNHVETTKRCVDQLLKETDLEKLNAELILIDHGSADSTLEYFEDLGIGKVIRFKKNVRMYMFTVLSQICQGEYFAFVSNDVLVTRNWAEILLACMGSDPKIITAIPATPNISNLQAVGLPDFGPEEFIAWAHEQNRSDSSRWNDRVRLTPPLGMYRTAAVSTLGFADPSFYSMEFWDDDFSLRARRAGYRQIVCNDVACYHFGSVTGKEAQVKENTLVYGRELFKRKNGVDAWGNGFCYDYQAVQLLLKLLPTEGRINILGLDCGMGDTPLQIANVLRHRKQDSRVYQLTSQAAYLDDIGPQSVEARAVASLTEGVGEDFTGMSFHCAVIGRDIGEYEDYPELLAAVSKKLIPGGWLVFSLTNPYFAITLYTLLQLSIPGGRGRCVLLDPEQVTRAAEPYFSQVQAIALEQAVDGLKEFAVRHFGKDVQTAILQRLKIQRYYFACKK